MSSELLTVTGTVFFRERIALPPGAVATVKLVDDEGEVLAAVAVEAPGVPTAFTLTADPTLAGEPERLLLWAALRSDVGTWGTVDLVPVQGDNAVMLTQIDT